MGKILEVIGVGVAGWIGYRWYEKRKKNAAGWPLIAAHAYAVHLQYNGAGVGGDPDQNTVQTILNANSSGGVNVEVTNQPTTDTTNKVLTFLIVAPTAGTLPSAELTTGWPSAYGTVSVLGVQDCGGAPAPPTA